MQRLLQLIEVNAKAIVALVATVVAGVGLDMPIEVQAALVTLLVWLIPNSEGK